METLGERLKRARMAAKLTQRELSRRARVTQQMISKLESGKASSTTGIVELARALGVSAEWLATGRGPMRPDAVREVSGHGRTVPVVSAIQAGEPREVVDAYERGDGFEHITIHGELAERAGPHTFALQVEGESMLPEFRPGDLVVVDPDRAPKPGSIVVAKLEREEAATLKKYRPRGFSDDGQEVFELVPLNPDWPTITVDSTNPGRVVGVVIEHRRRMV